MGSCIGWGGTWFGIFFWLVILALIIWMVISLTHRNREQHYPGSPSNQESALDILKKRYARGEISAGEFEQLKKDLQD